MFNNKPNSGKPHKTQRTPAKDTKSQKVKLYIKTMAKPHLPNNKNERRQRRIRLKLVYKMFINYSKLVQRPCGVRWPPLKPSRAKKLSTSYVQNTGTWKCTGFEPYTPVIIIQQGLRNKHMFKKAGFAINSPVAITRPEQTKIPHSAHFGATHFHRWSFIFLRQ